MVIIWVDSVGGSLARWTENPEAKVRLLLGPQYLEVWRRWLLRASLKNLRPVVQLPVPPQYKLQSKMIWKISCNLYYKDLE